MKAKTRAIFIAILSMPLLLSSASAAAATTMLTIDPATRTALGEFTDAFLAAKQLACESANHEQIDRTKCENVFSKFDLKVVDYDSGAATGPKITVANRAGKKYSIYLTSYGIQIDDVYRGVISEMTNNPCTIGTLTRHDYAIDGRLLREIHTDSANGTTEFDVNTPPKSLSEIYPCGYEGRSLADLEKIAEDTTRIAVAVIDIGLNYDDPKIAYKMDRKNVGWDFFENDATPSSFTDDPFAEANMGHGAATSTLAVQGSDHLRLIALRIDMNDVKVKADAIEYAIKNGARVINMSFTGYSAQGAEGMCNSIRNHPEVLFVAAAGNQGDNNNDQSAAFPASCPDAKNLIAVGSVGGFWNKKSGFSSFGKQSVQIAAHGEQIEVNHGYGKLVLDDGTSFAAPQVANVGAKMLVINPKLTPEQVIEILMRTAHKRPWLKKYFRSSGYLNERKALHKTEKTMQSDLESLHR